MIECEFDGPETHIGGGISVSVAGVSGGAGRWRCLIDRDRRRRRGQVGMVIAQSTGHRYAGVASSRGGREDDGNGRRLSSSRSARHRHNAAAAAAAAASRATRAAHRQAAARALHVRPTTIHVPRRHWAAALDVHVVLRRPANSYLTLIIYSFSFSYYT